MLRLIRENKWLEWRFLAALFAAAAVHAAFFSYVVLTMPGTPRQYRIDMQFWGSILRKQDLVPQALLLGGQSGRVAIVEPQKSLGHVHGGELGMAVDKPESRQWSADRMSPLKFLTERVVIDDALPDAVPGIPDALRVPLRAPQQ